MIQQLFNDVQVPRCHTENLSFENIFIPFKCSLLLFSRFYVLGYKYKRRDFLRAGTFAPVVSPSVTRLALRHVLLSVLLSKKITLLSQ